MHFLEPTRTSQIGKLTGKLATSTVQYSYKHQSEGIRKKAKETDPFITQRH